MKDIIKSKEKTLCKSEETIEEGYFLNKIREPYIWNECYENCATCEYKGNENKMKCITCRTNLKNKFNKNKYFILINGNCIESCENNLFLTKDGDCVTECPLGTYQFISNYNYSCLDSCPDKYKISSDNKKCELNMFPENITINEFKNIISKEIESNVNSTKIINVNNFKARILSSKDLSLNIFNSEQIFNINNLEEILNKIKIANNLEINEEIIIAQIEYGSNLKNNFGENIEILLYDSLGNKLIIPDNISNKFSITKYVGNLLNINFDESKWFYEKGINVFNESDPFFNDICYPFKNEFDSDVTIEDRRINYFQDINFCGDNCEYNTIDYELMNVICLCDSDLLNKEKNKENPIILNNNKNKFPKKLYKTNLIIIKCIKLAFDSSIIKGNIGFITNIIFLSFEIIFFVFFIINGLKPIKNFVLIFEPNSNAAPPKLSALKALAEPKNSKDEEIKKSKLINHLINAKKKKKNIEKKVTDDILFVNYSEEAENEENDKDSKLKNKIKKKINDIENKKSENSEIDSQKFQEKKTALKSNKLSKRKKKQRDIRVYSNKINNEEKLKEKEGINYNNINKLPLDNDLENNMDKLKRHMNLGNIHISNYKYLNKNTEEADLDSFNKKNRDNKESLEKKKKKNVKKIKNERKNNNLYSRQEFLYMEYEEALKNNKFKFSEIYLSYLIENNFILNTIISDSFINLIPIKISYLIFRLELFLALNAFFYSDKYISQTFENEGKINFFKSLPKAIYSLLVTILFCIVLKLLLNNKKEILDLIKRKEKTKFNLILNEILKSIKTKLIIYFTIQFIFTLFFLYYCSAFCAVYQNSQIFLIYGFLETILFDIIFSCLYCLFLTSIRLISIKKRIKCLYTITKIINYI